MLKPPIHKRDDTDKLKSLARSDSIHSDEKQAAVETQHNIFDIQTIKKFRKLFENSSSSSPKNTITEAEFKNVLQSNTDKHGIDNIYRKIDVSCEGCISFSSFTSYLLTANTGGNS
jgi:Ca2+-binding EF-hand superfamily protein